MVQKSFQRYFDLQGILYTEGKIIGPTSKPDVPHCHALRHTQKKTMQALEQRNLLQR